MHPDRRSQCIDIRTAQIAAGIDQLEPSAQAGESHLVPCPQSGLREDVLPGSELGFPGCKIGRVIPQGFGGKGQVHRSLSARQIHPDRRAPDRHAIVLRQGAHGIGDGPVVGMPVLAPGIVGVDRPGAIHPVFVAEKRREGGVDRLLVVDGSPRHLVAIGPQVGHDSHGAPYRGVGDVHRFQHLGLVSSERTGGVVDTAR